MQTPPVRRTLSPAWTRAARWALLGYLVVALFVLLQPQPTVAIDGVANLAHVLDRLGAPHQFTAPGRAEAIMNAGLFVPIGLLAVAGFSRLSWADVTAASFIASVSIEFIQGIFLTDRSTQAVDVVTNTGGGLIGGLLGVFLLSAKPTTGT